jgi:hypothetical protein
MGMNVALVAAQPLAASRPESEINKTRFMSAILQPLHFLPAGVGVSVPPVRPLSGGLFVAILPSDSGVQNTLPFASTARAEARQAKDVHHTVDAPSPSARVCQRSYSRRSVGKQRHARSAVQQHRSDVDHLSQSLHPKNHPDNEVTAFEFPERLPHSLQPRGRAGFELG